MRSYTRVAIWYARAGRIAACLALLALAGLGCGREEPPASAAASSEAENPVLRFEVFTLAKQNWPTRVRVPGSLFADEVAVIGAKVAGRVAEVRVDLGDTVAANAPLVILDRAEFQLQVSQAEAQLQQARAAVGLGPDDPLDKLVPENAPPVREVKAIWDEAQAKSKRWRELRAQNAVSVTDFEQVIAAEQVAAAQYAAALNGVYEKIALIGVRTAELDLARQRLQDAVVIAPFDGLVRERHVAPGSYVQVGQPIATIVRIDPLHFRGMMPERHARQLALGQAVTLQIEAVAEPRSAVVTRISPTLDPNSRSLLFEAEVANPDGLLRAGLFAEADVTLNPNAESLAVPESAIVEFAGVEKVWTVVDGEAREQVVLTGERRDGRVQVLEGLASGDVVLFNGAEGRVARVEPIFRETAAVTLTKRSHEPTESPPGTARGPAHNGGAQ